MRSIGSFRLAGRLARREVVRRPWRTLLVALLVAVPVAGMTMAAAFVRTENPGAEVTWRQQWGSADLVQSKSTGPFVHTSDDIGDIDVDLDVDDALPALPAGSRVVSWHSLHTLVRTVEPRHRAQLEVLDLPMTDPLAGTAMQVTSGRVPTAANEIFLTRGAARRLRVGVGDELRIDKPAALSLRVTGVGEQRAWWGSRTAVVGPGTAFPWTARADIAAGIVHAVDLPADVTTADVRRITSDGDGWTIAPWLEPYAQPRVPDTSGVAWSWVIGAVVLTVVGIVIASAFAAGARRQLSTLGQLSANGATPAVLRQVLFLQGTWAGLVGTVTGLGLGAAGLRALAPYADRMFSRDVDPWAVNVADLLPVALLGVAAATIAASVPAKATSRIPVLAALAGRRPLGRVPGWVTAAGVATGLGGLALLGLAVLGGSSGTSQVWALTAIVGGVAVLLGACGVTPGYTSVLEPIGGRLRGTWRLAARSLARQRTRTSAMVAAVCASGALAVAASALVLGADAHTRSDVEWMPPNEVHLTAENMLLPPAPSRTSRFTGTPIEFLRPTPTLPPSDLVAAVQGAMPGVERMQLTTARPSSSAFDWRLDDFEQDPSVKPDPEGLFEYKSPSNVAVVFDAPAADVYGLRAGHRAVLERDGALLLGGVKGRGTIVLHPIADDFPTRGSTASPTSTVPVAVVDARPYALGTLPRLLLTPAAAQQLGFVSEPGIVVLRQSRPLTGAQRSLVADLVDDARLELIDTAGVQPTTNLNAALHYPSDNVSPLLLEVLLTGVSLLFSLFVVAVGLALAAAETRDERDVLTIVGASPAAMRATSGRKAALLAALGAVLAVPVGFLPVVVFVAAETDSLPLVFPWRVVALLLFVVPVVAGVVTTLGSAAALRLRPVRVSTMAFD